MPDPKPDDSVCWQCGAPADPGSAYTQRLVLRSSLGADGEGFPVTRGRRMDTVRVSIPRCTSCQARNIVTATLIFAGFGIGALAGASFNDKGWGIPVTAFGIGLPLAFGLQWLEKRRGRRLLKDYPPLLRLRAAGWTDPNSN